jgi:DNA-directed RNA polymerase subunit H
LVSDYEIIPKHELLSESDAEKVIKKFNTSLDKLPKILESDQQALKLNAKIGQIIKISRNDGNVSYTYYRVVVKG